MHMVHATYVCLYGLATRACITVKLANVTIWGIVTARDFSLVLHCRVLKFTCFLRSFVSHSFCVQNNCLYFGTISYVSHSFIFMRPPNPHRLLCTNIWSFRFVFIWLSSSRICIVYCIRWKSLRTESHQQRIEFIYGEQYRYTHT